MPSGHVGYLLWWYAIKEALFMYHQRQNNSETDILRAKFTSWIEKLVKNAKIDYLRQNSRKPECISIEELFEDEQLIGDEDVILSISSSSFDFEEEKLAKAFCKLPLMKRRILELLFVDEFKPEVIAKRLNCSPQYVYDQRYRAIKKMRSYIEKDGDM